MSRASSTSAIAGLCPGSRGQWTDPDLGVRHIGQPGVSGEARGGVSQVTAECQACLCKRVAERCFCRAADQQADVAIARRMTWVDLLSYQRKFNRDPVVIKGMTGWFVKMPFVIAVNKANPVAKLTLAQIDGIFGAERDGGWRGATWDPTLARGPEKNVRIWGQLGLTGEWARDASTRTGTISPICLPPLFGRRHGQQQQVERAS